MSCPLERTASDPNRESPYREIAESPPGVADASPYLWTLSVSTPVNPIKHFSSSNRRFPRPWKQAPLKHGFNWGAALLETHSSGPQGPASFPECVRAKPIVRISRKPRTVLTRKEAAGNCPPEDRRDRSRGRHRARRRQSGSCQPANHRGLHRRRGPQGAGFLG